MNDNKNSFFLVALEVNYFTLQETYKKKKLIEIYEDKFEPILCRMNSSPDNYTIYDEKNDKTLIVFLFRTVTRKRVSLLRNQIQKHIDPYVPSKEYQNRDMAKLHKDKIIECAAITKNSFNAALENFRQDKSALIMNSVVDKDYSRDDIKIFDKRKNWYPWQEDFYNMIFTKTGKIKKPDDREIIFIEDLTGGSGKSKMLKMLLCRYGNDVGLLTEGTPSQLAHVIAQAGPKKIYLIDLPRTNSGSLEGLLHQLENLKNGVSLSVLFGSGINTIMDPPWIVVVGNSRLPMAGWTPDRWRVFNIKNNKLIDVSKSKQKLAKKLLHFQQIEKEAEFKKLEKKHEENLKLLSAL